MFIKIVKVIEQCHQAVPADPGKINLLLVIKHWGITEKPTLPERVSSHINREINAG